jgi:hypothetical protein
MRARLAVLATAVLGACVFGLYGDDQEKCEAVFSSPFKDSLQSIQSADLNQPFTCISEVLSETGEKKKTFVWVLHNDKPSISLYTKWDDAGMPVVRFPSSCRFVSDETFTKEKAERPSAVMYGPKINKKHELKTFLMVDSKPKKDTREDGEGKTRPGSPLESRIVCTFPDNADIKRVDIRFQTEVSEDYATYTYAATNNGSQLVFFSVDDLMKNWAKENLGKLGGKVKQPWIPAKEGKNLFILPPAESKRPKKENLRAAVFEVNPHLAGEPEETQVNCLFYAPDDTENPIGGGKITVYLPKRKD